MAPIEISAGEEEGSEVGGGDGREGGREGGRPRRRREGFARFLLSKEILRQRAAARRWLHGADGAAWCAMTWFTL